MQFTDLHIHSTISDGMLSPKEIVIIAKKKGIRCISVTDHDTVDSQKILSKLIKDKDLIIVPGIEISTEYKGNEIHILGYFMDINNKSLNDNLKVLQGSRKERAIDILKKLQCINISISTEEININKSSIGRPHIANALVEKGYATTVKNAFNQYLIKGKPAYVDRYKLNYKEALGLIKDSGGISVLAHPGEIYKGEKIENIIKEFKVYGLKGIEVFHPSHSTTEINDYYNLAKKYSILITGGSDCHGILVNNELLLGTYGLNENLTNKFLKSNNNNYNNMVGGI